LKHQVVVLLRLQLLQKMEVVHQLLLVTHQQQTLTNKLGQLKEVIQQP
jgi:hypothetical protein